MCFLSQMIAAELAEEPSPPVGNGQPPFGFRFVAPLVLGSTLNPINSTMLSTALVPIAVDFHANVAETGWLVAGLYLASSIAQPTMGRLADLFGPRRIYIISLFLVAAAGLIGQWAPSLDILVGARVLLGIGTSGAYPSAMRIFRTQADRIGSAPPRATMGLLSLAGVSTAAIGPLLGGVLTDAFGWHAIFIVNLPLALLAILLAILWIPVDRPCTGGFAHLMKELDLVGIGLFSASLLSLMAFMMNMNHPMWIVPGVAIVFGTAFAIHSLRRKAPFIDVRMLAHNLPLTVTYLRNGAVLMIVYCILYGFAQWLESGPELSGAAAGLVMLPLSVVAAISSLTGARTEGIRASFVISTGAAVVGCIALLFVNSATPLWIIAVAVVAFGIPQGMFATATQTAVYIQAPADEIGTAAGLQRAAGYIGAISAASLLGIVYGRHATDHGLHNLAIIIGVLSTFLFIATIFDRTLPRE